MDTKKALSIGAIGIGAYLIYNSLSNSGEDEASGSGSFGGEDDLSSGYSSPGYSEPTFSDNVGINSNQPEGFTTATNNNDYNQPTESSSSSKGGDIPFVQSHSVNIPSKQETTSSGLRDTAIIGGAIGTSLGLNVASSKLAKKLNEVFPTPKTNESALMKFIKDPYNVNIGTKSEIKAGAEAVQNIGVKNSKYADSKIVKGLKLGVNLIPGIDVGIGATADYLLSKYDDDPYNLTMKQALTGNILGEVAQLSTAGAGALAGSWGLIPGVIAGGASGWVVGTAVDVGTTEAYYYAIKPKETSSLTETISQGMKSASSGSSSSKSSSSSSSSSKSSSNDAYKSAVASGSIQPAPAITTKPNEVLSFTGFDNPSAVSSSSKSSSSSSSSSKSSSSSSSSSKSVATHTDATKTAVGSTYTANGSTYKVTGRTTTITKVGGKTTKVTTTTSKKVSSSKKK